MTPQILVFIGIFLGVVLIGPLLKLVLLRTAHVIVTWFLDVQLERARQAAADAAADGRDPDAAMDAALTQAGLRRVHLRVVPPEGESQPARGPFAPLDDAPDVEPDGTCGTCVHFDHAAGQQVIATQPHFRAASQHIPPWRMGRKLRVAEVDVDVLDDAGQPVPMLGSNGELLYHDKAHQRIIYETRKEEIPLPHDQQASPSILRLTWAQAGACGAHQQLVFPCGQRNQNEGPHYDELLPCEDYSPSPVIYPQRLRSVR